MRFSYAMKNKISKKTDNHQLEIDEDIKNLVLARIMASSDDLRIAIGSVEFTKSEIIKSVKSQNKITGYDNEPLVSINEGKELLKRKIVYARSCDAANNLGELCIKNGTIAFVGYRKKYSIAYTHSGSNHPLNDEIAKLFIEPSNLIPISLLKGNSVKDAYRKSQEAMSRNFSFMLSTKATQVQRDAAPYLWINKKYQVTLGDSDAKIV